MVSVRKRNIYIYLYKTLNINQKVSKAFQAKPLVAFRRSRNLQDLIGGNTILNNKVVRLNWSKGSSSRCNKGYGSKCCKQVMHTTSFKSTKTGRTYSIREKMNCKMAWLLYLCIKLDTILTETRNSKKANENVSKRAKTFGLKS